MLPTRVRDDRACAGRCPTHAEKSSARSEGIASSPRTGPSSAADAASCGLCYTPAGRELPTVSHDAVVAGGVPWGMLCNRGCGPDGQTRIKRLNPIFVSTFDDVALAQAITGIGDCLSTFAHGACTYLSLSIVSVAVQAQIYPACQELTRLNNHRQTA